jgi:hypothetical protein
MIERISILQTSPDFINWTTSDLVTTDDHGTARFVMHGDSSKPFSFFRAVLP